MSRHPFWPTDTQQPTVQHDIDIDIVQQHDIGHCQGYLIC